MFLGLDIGTTAVKAIIVDDDQRIVAEAATEHPTSRPRPGISEQMPEDWVAAAERCLAGLRASAPRAYSAIAAIGLSGQMHSPVLLGRDQKPLRPAMLWNDGRGADECAALSQAVSDIARVTGVVPMAGFSAAKILWVRHHEPEVFAKIAHVLLPKDYVRLWLTGEIASDISDAAGTQLLDEAARRFAPQVLNAVGLSAEQMPPLVEGTEIAGRLGGAVAAAFGLRPGLPVAAGGGDAGTGALGIGCIDDGQAFISLGTAAVFVVAQSRYAPAPETMLHDFAHCIPGRWYQMAGMLNGASCLAWVMNLIGESDADALLACVEERYRRPSRVIFLPYLTGERTPHNNRAARGAFFGLDATTEKLDLVQAVLEGVAFSLKDAQQCLAEAGCRHSDPGFIGGGARSALWGRIIANVLGRPIVRYEGARFGPALGAARLAMIAATGATVAEVGRPPERGTTVVPDDAVADEYRERHQTFRSLYRSAEELF